MLGRLDRLARWAVSWPLALLGIGLSFLSAWCVRLAAWIADIDLTDSRGE